ncbi:hypothetical protein KFL_003870040 [Klebsormidium nitens]|uniref:SET domain-containing protein n=1 Tax=Klebsormidium nitens TaxID=105231 RepID=A0A1Y1IGR8_KLENI|nr:hypothetical protein KFL_003870040 [Klebsormidium nitens]|eukprot:GAQ87907.1 hypothetical protein KFL_003870040 [Klebsormidium nitens]
MMAMSCRQAIGLPLPSFEVAPFGTFLGSGDPFLIAPLRTSSGASTSGSLVTPVTASKESLSGEQRWREGARGQVAAEAFRGRARRAGISEIIGTNAAATTVSLTDTQKALVEEAEEEQWGLYQLAMEGNTTKKVEFRGTRLGYHPELGKGIVAAYDIPAADKQRIILEVPSYLFCSLSAYTPFRFRPDFLEPDNPVVAELNETDEMFDGDTRLALLLLMLKNDDGYDFPLRPDFWRQYIGYYPGVEDCPSLLLATPDELAELQDDHLAQHFRHQQARSEALHKKHFTGAVPRRQRVMCRTLDEFRWALATARAYQLPYEWHVSSQAFPASALIPYADLLNHSDSANCTYRWNRNTQALEVVLLAGRAVAAGEQLTLAYHHKETNAGLMKNYSFALKKNRYERVTVESDARVHHDSLLSALGVAGIEDHYSYKGPSSSWRAQFVDGHVYAALRCLPQWYGPGVPPLPEDERAAALGLADAYRALLDAAPTTLQHDRDLLARAQDDVGLISVRHTTALKYRLERKEFISKIIEVLLFYADDIVL